MTLSVGGASEFVPNAPPTVFRIRVEHSPPHTPKQKQKVNCLKPLHPLGKDFLEQELIDNSCQFFFSI